MELLSLVPPRLELRLVTLPRWTLLPSKPPAMLPLAMLSSLPPETTEGSVQALTPIMMLPPTTRLFLPRAFCACILCEKESVAVNIRDVFVKSVISLGLVFEVHPVSVGGYLVLQDGAVLREL